MSDNSRHSLTHWRSLHEHKLDTAALCLQRGVSEKLPIPEMALLAYLLDLCGLRIDLGACIH